MLGDDLLSKCQSQTCPVGPCCEVEIEDLPELISRNSLPRVGHFNSDSTLIGRPRKSNPSPGRCCLEGVLEKVQDSLGEQLTVDPRDKAGFQCFFESNAFPLCLTPEQGGERMNNIRKRNGLEIGPRGAGKAQETLNDSVHPFGF